MRDETGKVPQLDPYATIAAWVDLSADLEALALALSTRGWTGAQLTQNHTQLDITGPSGIRIALWQGLERSTIAAQVSLGWLGPLGVMILEEHR